MENLDSLFKIKFVKENNGFSINNLTLASSVSSLPGDILSMVTDYSDELLEFVETSPISLIDTKNIEECGEFMKVELNNNFECGFEIVFNPIFHMHVHIKEQITSKAFMLAFVIHKNLLLINSLESQIESDLKESYKFTNNSTEESLSPNIELMIENVNGVSIQVYVKLNNGNNTYIVNKANIDSGFVLSILEDLNGYIDNYLYSISTEKTCLLKFYKNKETVFVKFNPILSRYKENNIPEEISSKICEKMSHLNDVLLKNKC